METVVPFTPSQALRALMSTAWLGYSWNLPTPVALAANYGSMLVAQTRGSSLIEVLHNKSAAVTAELPPDDVRPDMSLAELCAGYESHHWESTSNSLHAAGMLLTFLIISVAISCKSLRAAAAVAPTWYLFAWAGHFEFQADIPAVFTYGMTLRGWASGEYCSVCALLAGRTVGSGPGGPAELMLTALLLATYLLAARPALVSWCSPHLEKNKLS